MFTSHDDIHSSLCNLAIVNEHLATHNIYVRITVPVSGTSLSVFQIPGTRFTRFTQMVCFVPRIKPRGLAVWPKSSCIQSYRHFMEAVSPILNPRTHRPSTGMVSPYPDLLPDVFCLMVRIFRLMLVFIYIVLIFLQL